MTGRLASGPAGDTIFALASGAERAAIAVLRLSGTSTAAILRGMCGGVPPERTATLRPLRDQNKGLLDRAMVLWMPGPRSYTGEDVAELHLHGGRAVVDGVMAALILSGARPADPGEFTRRAVMAGKMNLLTAEAIADLIASETILQRDQALRGLSGDHMAVLDGWAATLTRFLAWQEALIDFPDEDLPADAEQEMLVGLRSLLGDLHRHLGSAERGEKLRRGLVFAIVGQPNVGKSSLLNALAGRDAAIVSPHPGTTRDAVSVELVLEGIPVTLVDTAGIRETTDPIEREGVRRALQQAELADWRIRVIDHPGDLGEDEDRTLLVVSKIDLNEVPNEVLGVSALTGIGLDRLRQKLAAIAATIADPGNATSFGRARHLAALHDIDRALRGACASSWPELRAEELRIALAAIGRLTGAIDVEDVLDVVFSSFCIGK